MVAEEALYYPHIDLPGENWLKANLIMFPRVHRVLPPKFIDESEYTELFMRKKLLVSADLGIPTVDRGFSIFRRRLNVFLNSRRKSVNLLKNFGLSNDAVVPVSIHSGKLGREISEYLKDRGLAETSRDGFLYMHPALGEVLMSTIAISCAEYQGLSIVTENGRIHKWLKNMDVDEAFDSIIDDEYILSGGDFGAITRCDNENSAYIALFSNADLSKVSVDSLVELSKEREAIESLKKEISELCRNMTVVGDVERHRVMMSDLTSDIIRRWNSDRCNLSGFWRGFFGDDLSRISEDLLKSAFGGSTVGLALGIGASAEASASIIAAGSGFLIGVFFHANRSWSSVRNRERNSPYRYLTMCEKQGVVFAPS